MKKKIVCIGGGNGTSQVLKGLRSYPVEVTGIIGVTDSGRSTGKARILANIPAPGDIRNALISLSGVDEFIRNAFQFRFKSERLPDYDGMALGNLFIAALSQMTGSFEKAVEQTSKLLKVRGSVLPIMIQSTHIACERTDGTIDVEEINVRRVGKAPIKRLFLTDSSASLHPKARVAIQNADIITIGPGSLFTTIIGCLLTPGLKDALSHTQAKVVFLMNTTSQSGQTEGYSVENHFTTLCSYLAKNTIDICLVNNKKPSEKQLEKLDFEGTTYLPLTRLDIKKMKGMVNLIQEDLIEKPHAQRSLWNKQDTICHDPQKVAKSLMRLLKK